MAERTITTPGVRRSLFRLGTGIRLGVLAISAAVALLAGVSVVRERTDALEDARIKSQNLVRMLSQHTERTFDSVNLLLETLIAELAPDWDDPYRQQKATNLLLRVVPTLPHVVGMRVFRHSGSKPVFEFGTIARTLPFDQVDSIRGLSGSTEISDPVFDPVTNSWLLTVGRYFDNDGSDDAFAFAIVDLGYLNGFYRTIEKGAAGTVAMLRKDGTMLARHPASSTGMGKKLSGSNIFKEPQLSLLKGTYETRSTIDGIERVLSFERLTRIPVVVSVGITRDDALSAWWGGALATSAMAALAIIILIVSGERLVREIANREKAEKDLRHAADFDALSGLANRSLFHRIVEEEMTAARRDGGPLSMALLDLDGFKEVNDTKGHHIGDCILVEAAQRLRDAMGEETLVIGRLGGDEFAVLLKLPLEDVGPAMELILATLSVDFVIQGMILQISASIGVASTEGADGAQDCLKNADLALYAAKAQGRNRYCVYTQAMGSELLAQVALRQELKDSIQEDRFEPFYQPQVCLETGEVFAVEALARWRHPTRGLLSAAEFQQVFDDRELAAQLGAQLRRRVYQDMLTWLDAGHAFRRVAINVAGSELQTVGFALQILAELNTFGIPGKHLEIEVTEGVFFGKQASAIRAEFDLLRTAGISLALDDFGTGYASLTHLKQFSVDAIKIDQSFVREMGDNPDSAVIVEAVIKLGRSLHLDVIAEGVETEGQRALLKQLGCTAGQGYLFAKPMPGTDLAVFLRSHAYRPLLDEPTPRPRFVQRNG